MTVLEAATLNLPILARRSAGLEGLGLEPLYDTPAAIVAATEALLDERHRAHQRVCSQRLLERHGTDAQRRTLEQVYAVAAEAARPAPRWLRGRDARGPGNGRRSAGHGREGGAWRPMAPSRAQMAA